MLDDFEVRYIYIISNLTGHSPPNDVEMELKALPTRLGGLAIGITSLNSDDAFDNKKSFGLKIRNTGIV